MKTYPARFVGEFSETHYDEYKAFVPNIGDVAAFLLRGVRSVAIRCACGEVTTIPVDGSRGWQLMAMSPVHLEPSVLTRHYFPADRPEGVEYVCHYYVHVGQLQMLDDTTAPLK